MSAGESCVPRISNVQATRHFRPNLSPKQVLQMGSFGGTYFRPIFSSVTGKVHKDAYKEFPEDWFEGLDIKKQITRDAVQLLFSKLKFLCIYFITALSTKWP